VLDLLLCLGVLKYRVPLAGGVGGGGGGGTSLPYFSFTMDFFCGAILSLKAFCFGAIPDIMIELLVYGSVPQSWKS
jgi:hypothetical protein